jgi:hypothetical protein
MPFVPVLTGPWSAPGCSGYKITYLEEAQTMSARHNDHPEDAMTRERALGEAARELDRVASDSSYGDAYRYAARHFAEHIRALASAQQEPAPAADAEGVAKELAAKLFIEATVDDAAFDCDLATPIIASALRRYAGDGGVTEQQSEEALEDAAVQLEARAYDLEHLYDKKAHADEIFDIAQELRSRTAARAKSDEKGGANV